MPYRRVVGDSGDGRGLVGRDVFDLGEHTAGDADGKPVARLQKVPLKAPLLGRHDHRVVDRAAAFAHRDGAGGHRYRLGIFEGAEAHQGQYLENFLHEALRIGLLGFRHGGFLGGIAIVQVATLDRVGPLQQRVFQPSDMGAIQPAAGGDKHHAPIPKVFQVDMLFNAVADPVGLADVERRQIVILALVTYQDIDAGFGELGALADLGPFAAREDDAQAGPVHAVDDAHALGIAIGDENADGEGIGSHGRRATAGKVLVGDAPKYPTLAARQKEGRQSDPAQRHHAGS